MGLNFKIQRTLHFVLDYSESHQEIKERVNLLQDHTRGTHGESVVDFEPVMLHFSLNDKLVVSNNFTLSINNFLPVKNFLLPNQYRGKPV